MTTERDAAQAVIDELENDKAYVREILEEAMRLASDLQVEGSAWDAAFVKAADLLDERRRVGRVVLTDTQKYVHAADSMISAIDAKQATEAKTSSGHLNRIAARLRLDPAVVADVFDDSDGTIDVIVAPRKLDPAKARATKQLALLIVAARQAAEIEEWTDVDEIRKLAEDYKRYDSANFASAIKEMQDDFRLKQVGRKITVKLGRPGWDRAAEMVRRLAGEE